MKKEIIKLLLTNRYIKPKPKCFAYLYYPYSITDDMICDCQDKCKYSPPPSLIIPFKNKDLQNSIII